MDPLLATLVASGATTIVSAMATDSWEKVKAALKRVFSHGEVAPAADVMLSELDGARAQILGSADGGQASLEQALTADVAAQLKLLLMTDTDARNEFEEFVSQFAETDAGVHQAARDISLKGKATGHGRVYQVGQGDQYNA